MSKNKAPFILVHGGDYIEYLSGRLPLDKMRVAAIDSKANNKFVAFYHLAYHFPKLVLKNGVNFALPQQSDVQAFSNIKNANRCLERAKHASSCAIRVASSVDYEPIKELTKHTAVTFDTVGGRAIAPGAGEVFDLVIRSVIVPCVKKSNTHDYGSRIYNNITRYSRVIITSACTKRAKDIFYAKEHSKHNKSWSGFSVNYADILDRSLKDQIEKDFISHIDRIEISGVSKHWMHATTIKVHGADGLVKTHIDTSQPLRRGGCQYTKNGYRVRNGRRAIAKLDSMHFLNSVENTLAYSVLKSALEEPINESDEQWEGFMLDETGKLFNYSKMVDSLVPVNCSEFGYEGVGGFENWGDDEDS